MAEIGILKFIRGELHAKKLHECISSLWANSDWLPSCTILGPSPHAQGNFFYAFWPLDSFGRLTLSFWKNPLQVEDIQKLSLWCRCVDRQTEISFVYVRRFLVGCSQDVAKKTADANIANRPFYMFLNKCTVTLPLYWRTEGSECSTEVTASYSNTPATQILLPSSPVLGQTWLDL